MGYSNNIENATEWQITLIEGLIWRTSLTYEEKEEIERIIFDTSLSYDKAEEILTYLKMNKVVNDPKEQFKNFKF